MKKGDQITYPHKLARLAKHDNDLTKRWFVVYYAWSEIKQELVRKRMEIKGATLEIRKREARKEIGKINRLLKDGGLLDHIAEPVVLPLPKLDKLVMPTLASAIEYFMEAKKRTMKEKAHGTYRSSMKTFSIWLASQQLTHLKLNLFTTAQAHAYLDHLLIKQHLSNKSHNKHLGVQITLFNFYLKRKTIKEHPFADITKLSERPGQHTAFSKVQVQQIRQFCDMIQDRQLWLFLNFIYYTFARPGTELRLLKVGDVLERTIRVDVDNAKNNRTAHVLIPPPLEVLIQEHNIRDYPPGYYVFGNAGVPGEKPTYEKYFYNQHRRALTMLKLDNQDFDLYGWKHTGVIAAYQRTDRKSVV